MTYGSDSRIFKGSMPTTIINLGLKFRDTTMGRQAEPNILLM